jgi:hypothetical protein
LAGVSDEQKAQACANTLTIKVSQLMHSPAVYSGPSSFTRPKQYLISNGGRYGDYARARHGTPWNVDVAGDRAYFVAPMIYTYQQHGKPVKEAAAFAVALKRTQAGWRITAWSYAKQ